MCRPAGSNPEEHGDEAAEECGVARWQVYVKCASSCSVERLEVAEGLGHLEHAKRERFAWNGEVLTALGGDDDEDPGVRAAFV